MKKISPEPADEQQWRRLGYVLELLGPGAERWRVIATAETPAIGFAAYYAAIRADLGGPIRLNHEGRPVARHPDPLPERGHPKPAEEWAIYNLDAELRFMSANAAALAYWGLGVADVLGRRLTEVFPQAAGSSSYEAHLQATRSFEVYRGEVLSPVLRRVIDLAIFPHARGLRVAFRLAQ